MSIPTAVVLSWLLGCNLLANLGQFDGAEAAGVDGGGQGEDGGTDAGQPPPDTGRPEESGPPAEASSGDAGDAGGIDLIRNPGFEQGISPWTTFSDGALIPTLAVSSRFAHTGTFSGWVSNRTQTFEGTVQE
ncbi:MAG: hypothetical protein JOZ69_02390, partial [Myxococcales bacterium]|nr:hypothetical protein [Myxococcales bacterium]